MCVFFCIERVNMFVYLEIQTEEPVRFSYLSVSSEESVGERDAEIEADGFQDISLHGEQLRLLVGIVTDIQEVIQTRRHALLKSRNILSLIQLSIYCIPC